MGWNLSTYLWAKISWMELDLMVKSDVVEHGPQTETPPSPVLRPKGWKHDGNLSSETAETCRRKRMPVENKGQSLF